MRHIAMISLMFAFIASAEISHAEVQCLAYTYRGGFCIVKDGMTSGKQIPKSFISWCKKFESEGRKITSVAFTKEGGYAILYGKNGYRYWNVPDGLVKALRKAHDRQQTFLCVAISRYRGWYLITEESIYWGGDLPVSLKEHVNMESSKGGDVKMVGFNSYGGWFFTYKDQYGESKYWSADPTKEQRVLFLD